MAYVIKFRKIALSYSEKDRKIINKSWHYCADSDLWIDL